MDRRNFIERLAIGSGAFATTSLLQFSSSASPLHNMIIYRSDKQQLMADVVIAGGGLGGCAAAFAALRNNLTVILTEETDWLGGQLTSQGVPPDEHQWIESHGATQLYREFRAAVRQYYKRNYPLTEEVKNRENLNPGNGSVSRLCHEPRVAVAVLQEMMAPYLSAKKLVLLMEHKITNAKVNGRKVENLDAKDLRSHNITMLSAPYFVDATELGELLPLTGTEYVTGAESREETRELHAPDVANPINNQAFTVCFAIDYQHGKDNTIPMPKDYDFWKNYEPKMKEPWSGKMLDLKYSNPRTLDPKVLGFHPEGKSTGEALNLWIYRRIIDRENFDPGFYGSDITIVNWPQNDYLLGDIVEADEETFSKHVDQGKQLSLSLLYWLQTEAPRPDGGKGWPGLRLRGDIMGTQDGMAKYPYVRESRRIKALFTVLEEHVGAENRGMITGKIINNKAKDFFDSVGIGYYHIDLHPSSGGDNYIDFGSLPFQIPLGCLIPIRMENLLPANKNIGTTHLTNGCYRLHPVEWSIGEAVGMLVAYSLAKNVLPREVRAGNEKLNDFQEMIRAQGIETHWP
ncbi:FAD-dependent oxidoreductase [Algoriphagus aquimarinus]|uniref:FAD-dependent oxidoreductase n=1 Tax=Algoriphagus aquimarinus TaxID=237018 RepID=UPI0030DA3596|tara:strand:- start:67 stop:1785 length:1719 start_codon:yes stop_codon:yes gene_type:complete